MPGTADRTFAEHSCAPTVQTVLLCFHSNYRKLNDNPLGIVQIAARRHNCRHFADSIAFFYGTGQSDFPGTRQRHTKH